MTDRSRLSSVLEDVAARWRDPEHPVRQDAVQRTLEASNRFTEEAIAFAINQQMAEVTAQALERWAGGRRVSVQRAVGVLGAGNIPFADLQDFLAVSLVGHRYIGVVSSKSPHLLPAFVAEVQSEVPALPAAFVPYSEMVRTAYAAVATGSDETISTVRQDLLEAGVDEARLLLRGHRYSVAVVDGRESEPEREALAEDALLHEGLGCRNVAIIFAPVGLSPDPYLDAMAHFRGVFPAHDRTPGSLKMHQAMLAAVDVPHAYGEGLEFLVSKGDPEPQVPAHIRWSEYGDLSEAAAWIDEHRDRLQAVVARSHLLRRLHLSGVETLEPGLAQRPRLDWQPDRVDTVGFLYSLDADAASPAK